jgi:hypothetical protein
MKELVCILHTMHETSVLLFERKKAALQGENVVPTDEVEQSEGDLGAVIGGRDIMSALCTFWLTSVF